jgi:hypothetical protein
MNIVNEYDEFLKRKQHLSGNFGFKPNFIPDIAFDFQSYIIENAVKKGRQAIFADTGLGKTLIELSIAQNIVKHTNKRVLILTPLAVAFQFIIEAAKIGIDDIEYTKDGKHTKKIVLCNYERLHYLNENDFVGIILDESSILKNFDGKIKGQITAFVKKMPYRFLGTATPSPNDYIELGTSSEVLGYLPYMEMLTRFFANNENNIRPQEIGCKWYLKPHARDDFFKWIKGWAISIQKPSDLGFSDERYILPELIKNIHTVRNDKNWVVNGQVQMFNINARTMTEVKQEQQMTIENRCIKAVELAQSHETSVYWCNYNAEGYLLQALDKTAYQLKGSMDIDKKEDILLNFAKGDIKKIITKAKITAFGLNWQHCNHTTYFPDWSYEKYYQAIRRFWRFGQLNDVTADLVISDGQKRVMDTLILKTEKAKEMFQILNNTLHSEVKFNKKEFNKEIILPTFLK